MVQATLSRAENYLSLGALVPGLGLIPGVLKVGLGLVQTITGIVMGILSTFVACCYSAFKEYRHLGLVHTVHGMGNMLAGITEAIPLIGTAIVLIRIRRNKTNVDAQKHPRSLIEGNAEQPYIPSKEKTNCSVTIDTGQGMKFLAYRDLLNSFLRVRFTQIDTQTKSLSNSISLNYRDALAKKIPVDKIATYWFAV